MKVNWLDDSRLTSSLYNITQADSSDIHHSFYDILQRENIKKKIPQVWKPEE
jgi:hypothetical protein